MGVKSKAQKVIAAALVSAMAVSFIPEVFGNNDVQAATTKNLDNTIYGNWGICRPGPLDADEEWTGSYVWFGSAKNARKYRVLAPDTVRYGMASVLLDCDSAVCYKMFEGQSAKWEGSEMQSYLNNTFYNSEFTNVEKNAIMVSKESSGRYSEGSYEEYAFGKSTALNDKIFLLDGDDVLNPDYGYSSYPGHKKVSGTWTYKGGVKNHMKSDGGWWLRTTSNIYPDSCMAVVDDDGSLSYGVINSYTYYGVSPALNIQRSKIVFATAVNGYKKEPGTEYKLTLQDNSMHISASYTDLRGIEYKTTASGRLVEIPYSIAGGADRVSVIILDRSYSGGNGNGGVMLYYDELDTSGAPGDGGTGTFILPDEFDFDEWGTEYRVYILAEKLNGGHFTDYASNPVEVSMPRFYIDVVDGKADKVFANKGETVTITADPAPTGMRFTHWESYGKEVSFNNPKSAKTTFKMAGGEGYVLACYEFVEHKLTVEYDPQLVTVDGIESTDHSVLETEYKFTVKLNGAGTISVTANGKPVNPSQGYFAVVQPDEDLVVKIEAERNYSEEWVEKDGYWYYYDRHGWMYADEWCDVNGYWYYFDAEGRMMTDWQKIDGAWYYLGGNGQMRKGWQQIDGVWYYLGGNGHMRTNWQQIDGEWYYFGSNGSMRTGWQTINGSVYYLKPSGVMAYSEYCKGYWLNSDGTWTYEYRASWRKDSTGWWYGDASGWYAKNATYKIDDKLYDFDSSGYCTTPNGY